MGSVCRCLFQYCCRSHPSNTDDDVDEPENDHPVARRPSYSSVAEYVHPIEGRGLLISNRGEQPLRRHNNTAVGGVSDESSSTTLATSTSTVLNEDEDNATTTCCRPAAAAADSNQSSLFDVIRRRMHRWNNNNNNNQYNAIVTGNDLYSHHFSTTKDCKMLAPSPLRQAVSFTATNDINHLCTIHADEIVLPGSMIQQQMAEQMILSTGKSITTTMVDECVICMEPFDSSNPRMPTVCHCGTNKTYFHLPCLYQWIEQSEDCPSCRTKITWEEF